MKCKSGNEITFDQATELYILRNDKAWSWYELAERYSITTNDAREVFEAAQSGNLEFDDEEGAPFGDGGEYSIYGSSDEFPAVEPEQTTAERIAEQARDYYQDTINSAISPADVEKADAYTSDHLALTVEVMTALGIFHASDRMLVAIAQAMRWTLDDIEAEAMEQAHEDAARQLISAYAEAIGDAVTEDDPEAIAAHQVAREAIGYTTATEEQRATVDAMVQAIADRATQDPDEDRYARAEQDAAQDWQGEGWYSLGYSDGAMDTNPHYWEGRDELASEYAEMYRTATAAHLPTCEYYGDGEEPADLGAGQYQRHELEAFLGDYVSAYDVDAIEAEATTYVYSEDKRYWRKYIDLAAIAERHEISA